MELNFGLKEVALFGVIVIIISIILLGKVINVLDSFKEGLPEFHLDGELWYVIESCMD
jgi:hypothetical protein